jgi:hypothetical protein
LALSVQHPLLVVGTGQRDIQIFNLAKPNVVYKQVRALQSDQLNFEDPLKAH